MLSLVIFVVALLQTSLVQCEEVTKDVPNKKARSIDDSWHNQYHNLGQIVEKIREINSTYDNVKLFSIGKSYEGRSMNVIKISGKQTENKPVFFIQCLIHGNEWMTGAACMYFADKLSSLYGSDSTVTEMLDKMDVIILPVMNVDGYSYSRANSNNAITRNFPKNRRRVTFIGSKRCYGVDLNRNFGYQWGFKTSPYSSTVEPCHNTFRGFSAFSESETRSVRSLLASLGSNLKGFIDIQQSDKRNAWQMPWKYTYTDNPDHQEQKRAGLEAAKAIYKVGYRDSYQSCCQAVYLGRAGGSCLDWVYGSLKVKYSYAVAMKERRGYALATVSKALLEGLKTLVKTMQV